MWYADILAAATHIRALLSPCPPVPVCHFLLSQNAHTMTPVRSVSSPQLILSFVAVSAVVTAASIPFWGKNLRTTGTQYWLENGNGVSYFTGAGGGKGLHCIDMLVTYFVFNTRAHVNTVQSVALIGRSGIG